MSYLSDYVYYSSGNETPEEYVWWSGLSILGHVLGHKVWVEHGDYFKFRPNLYVNLVGEAGSGKNTGLGVNIDIMINHFPHLMVSASIQSREDVADLMASDQCMKIWIDRKGDLGAPGRNMEYRPFYILNNELASFLSVDTRKMVEFLTDVFDSKRFSTGFKGQRTETPNRKQWFDSPHVSLLAGAVPQWFMGNLKMDLFSGGLGRRMIIVNSTRTKEIAVPKKPIGADEAMKRVVEHLKQADIFAGRVTLDNKALTWWREWYHKWHGEEVTDPILGQFKQTEPMQVLKIALCLRCTELPLGHEMTADHLAFAHELLVKLRPSIIKLTAGIGRNELANVGASMLDFIQRMGGVVGEKKMQQQYWRYLRDPEFAEIINHYIKTGKLEYRQFEPTPGKIILAYMSPEYWQAYQERGKNGRSPEQK